MRLIDADVLKQHIDKLPALPDGNFAGNHSALKALINMQPTFESSTNCSEIQNSSDCISRQAAIDAIDSIGSLDTDADREYARGIFNALPSAQPDDWMGRNKERILQAGMEGREIEFRICGRLFAIREKAQ